MFGPISVLRKFILEEKIIVLFRTLLILLDGIPLPGQLIMPALTLAINMNFPLLLKLDQSNKQNFSQRINPPTSMGWINVVNTRL